MKKISVEFKFNIPDSIYENSTIEEIQDWVEFQLGYNGHLKKENPLFNIHAFDFDMAGIWVNDEQ